MDSWTLRITDANDRDHVQFVYEDGLVIVDTIGIDGFTSRRFTVSDTTEYRTMLRMVGWTEEEA